MGLATYGAARGQGRIVLYEGNNGDQNIAGNASDAPGQFINFKKVRGFKNDEARSLELKGVRRGAVITLYDSPTGAVNDDYVVIRVLRPTPAAGWIVRGFEGSYRDGYVEVSYTRNNGLNGKVSSMRVE